MTDTDTVLIERDGPVTIVSINRPHCRNAVDGATARKLFDAFRAFDADESPAIPTRSASSAAIRRSRRWGRAGCG
jgi:enoyl-CoA hydratase